jgi:hypothetical protein
VCMEAPSQSIGVLLREGESLGCVVSFLHARSRSKTMFALAPDEANDEECGSVTDLTRADIKAVIRLFP